jgi:hypothetical protein
LLFAPPPDQPQSVGDLVGRSFRIFRRNVPVFFKVLLGPTLITSVGSLGIQWVPNYGMTTKGAGLGIAAAVAVVSLFILAFGKWLLTLRQLAFVRMVTGFAPDYETAAKFVQQKKWNVLAIFCLAVISLFASGMGWGILMALVAFLGRGSVLAVVLTVAGEILCVAGLFLTIAAVLMISYMILCVVACEETSLSDAISRGYSLVLGDFWRSCSFLLLLVTAVTSLLYPLSIPILLITFGDAIQHNVVSDLENYTVPLYVMVISQIWESLVNMMIWPVAFMACGLYYYDVRIRQEGLDISRRLDEFEKLETNPA